MAADRENSDEAAQVFDPSCRCGSRWIDKVGAQQQASSLRRIGALWSLSETNPDMQARLTQFNQGLVRLGWLEGKNIHLDGRFSAGEIDRFEFRQRARGVPTMCGFKRVSD